MSELSQFFFDAIVYLYTVFIGEDFNKPLPYLLGFVAIFFLISLHNQNYNLGLFRNRLKSMGVTLVIYFTNVLGFAPIFFLAKGSIAIGYDKLNLPHLDPQIWQDMPVWLLVIFVLLFFDFADYWNHRLMHKSWLWPVHAIHHSETEMTGLTIYRVHFLEPFIMGVSYILLLSWLGLPKEVLGSGAIILTLHNAYVHMDIDWGHGPFRHILASPRYHRWHHADVPEAHGKNLANIFPFYDVLFGTYYVPGTCTKPLGAHGVPENDAVQLLLYPFKEWGKMLWVIVFKSYQEDETDHDTNIEHEKHSARLSNKPTT